jgi:hypothetical protein
MDDMAGHFLAVLSVLDQYGCFRMVRRVLSLLCDAISLFHHSTRILAPEISLLHKNGKQEKNEKKSKPT